MSDKKEACGMEASFVSAWEGWDEMDTSDLYFYDVVLVPGVFPQEVYDHIANNPNKTIDLGIWGQSSIVELNMEDEDEPFFKGKFKLSLVEE